MAKIVRKAVHKLAGSPPPSAAEARKRSAFAAIGRFASGRGDVSKEHDRYLDEAYGR